MRKILGFGVVLAVASLTGTVGVTYGQTGTGNVTTTPGSLITAPANSVQAANDAAAANRAGALNRAAAAEAAVTGQPTTPAPNPAGTMTTTTPGNTYQAPGTTGTVVNPAGAGGVQTYPGNVAPGTINTGTGYQTGATYPGAPNTTTYSSNYYAPGVQAGTYPGPSTGATPGYTNRVMPGMAGYNAVNPMATTMAPGYYYAGTGGMPYATYNTPGYSSMYVTPGYYPTQVQNYTVRPRRGLFGRRNRVVYPASPYGTTYGSSPYGYNTYGSTTYSPYGYSTNSTTTYSTVPGTYTYSPAPN
jgi:hypothetical protein